MSSDPQGSLRDGLDGHIALLRDLVAVSQEEQRHLIAFEPASLFRATEEKRILASQLEASEASLKDLLAGAAEAAGMRDGGAPTVASLAKALPAREAELLRDRAECLAALAGTLRELSAMSLVHAERGTRIVRAYTALLRSWDPTGPSEATGAYTARGRPRPEPVPAGTVSRNA